MFWPLIFAGVAAFPSNATTIIEIFWETCILTLPSLKQQIRVFIIIFRRKLQEFCGVEVAAPLLIGPKTYQLYLRREDGRSRTSGT